jgi:uncharacterized protein (DUF1501 family)
MLTILGTKHTFCDSVSRRNFLRIGALGAGLTLADLLHVKAARASAAPARKRSAKSAILIWLGGGPSHIDTYDLKPDAPAEYRGELKPIKTKVPGFDICELMPLQAQLTDKLALVRSCASASPDSGHNDAEVTTGYCQRINFTEQHPSMGSVISKLREGSTGGIPPYVNLRPPSIFPNGPVTSGAVGVQPGFLGMAHRPFTPLGPDLDNLRPARGVNTQRVKDRRTLLSRFDKLRRDIDASGAMRGLDAFTGQAFEMVASGAVRKALDLSQEEPRIRDRYRGLEPFLTARRLVETGVGCVTLSFGLWDTHSANFPTLKQQLPLLDRGIANLIQDLHDRGLENDVVTLVCGEMGRTPRINTRESPGRDHWPAALSVLAAGGGLKMGQVIGATDAHAEHPVGRPYSMSQILSTVYHALGIDPSQTLPNKTGRPVYLLDDREPVAPLMG